MSLQVQPARRLRPQDLLAVPFAIIRVPLSLLDHELVRRLDDRSRVRAVFDRSLGTLDIVVGHLLDDDGITRYGKGRVQTALHRDAQSIVVGSARRRSGELRSPSALQRFQPAW